MKATRASSTYSYPLLVRQLWHTPMHNNPDAEIVSGRQRRYSYRELRDRVGRLASGLDRFGGIRGAFAAEDDQ